MKPFILRRRFNIGQLPQRPRYLLPPGPLGRCYLKNSRRQFDPPLALVWFVAWLLSAGLLIGVCATSIRVVNWFMK